jgi:ketosteroid isomerase-like protein
MSRELRTIRRMCAALAERDEEAFNGCLAPDVVWFSTPGVTARTMYVGREGVAEWRRDFQRRGRCSATHFGRLGDGRVVAFGTVVVRSGPKSGYGFEAAWVIAFDDGLVTRVDARSDHSSIRALRELVPQLVAARGT